MIFGLDWAAAIGLTKLTMSGVGPMRTWLKNKKARKRAASILTEAAHPQPILVGRGRKQVDVRRDVAADIVEALVNPAALIASAMEAFGPTVVSPQTTTEGDASTADDIERLVGIAGVAGRLAPLMALTAWTRSRHSEANSAAWATLAREREASSPDGDPAWDRWSVAVADRFVTVARFDDDLGAMIGFLETSDSEIDAARLRLDIERTKAISRSARALRVLTYFVGAGVVAAGLDIADLVEITAVLHHAFNRLIDGG